MGKCGPNSNKTDIERFNQKYVIDEDTGCWNWLGSISSGGYGKFAINKSWIEAHRFSYQYYVGPLIEGLVCCHSCNNRKCCNPKHLRQDTYKSNSIDMVISGNQWHQKLSVEEVIQIKKELKHYYRGQINDLANFYKVNPTTITLIKTGKRWSHVEVER